MSAPDAPRSAPPAADEKSDPGPSRPRAVEEIVSSLQSSSMEDVLRIQDQLQKVLHEKYERCMAVLFSDIVGSTRYFERYGDAAGRRMIQRHQDLVVPIVERFEGRVVKTIGDAVMAAFPSAAKAVAAAVAMQQAISEVESQVTREEDRVEIRIGVNFGTALVNDSDGDLYGDMVNVAARVQAHARARQILVAESVREQLPATMPLRSVGAVAVKGKRDQVLLHEVIWREMERPSEDLPQLDPRYVVSSKLGAGGMASVWRARDERLGREVALKVLHRNLPFSLSMRQRLEREARVAAGLIHENVVQVYDVGVHEDRDSFIAMELVEGRTLRSYVERLGSLPSFAAALIAYEVARGLGYAHDRGVVHRDVKPDNVLISDRGAVKVADFGIALMDELVRLTASGVPVGTPAYVSPEQVKGEAADCRSDVFAFGILLYETCTGRLPFNGNSPSAVMYKIVEGDYPPPQAVARIEPELADVIARCLKRDRAERFANAGELGEALRPLLQRWSVVDPRATLATYVMEGNLRRGPARDVDDVVPTRPPPPRGRRRGLLVATAGVAGLIAATGALIAFLGDASTAVEPPPEAVAAPAPAPSPPPAEPPAVEPPPPPPQVVTASAVVPAPVPPSSRERTPRKVRPSRAMGTLEVSTSGAWADVFVDGEKLGRSLSATRFDLPAGAHVVELRNPLRVPWKRTVKVERGRTTTIRAELRPLP